MLEVRVLCFVWTGAVGDWLVQQDGVAKISNNITLCNLKIIFKNIYNLLRENL
jgi:hypothetical protein